MKNFSKFHLKPWGVELVAKYPLIFTEINSDNVAWARQAGVKDEDYVNLRYGFECGEGWKGLIEDIAKKATEIVTYLRNRDIHCLPCGQETFIHSCIVKEKFGGLEWQGSAKLPPLFQDLWYAYQRDISARSYQTCEVTGGWAEVRRTKGGNGVWVKTLCKEEAIKQGYDLEKYEN